MQSEAAVWKLNRDYKITHHLEYRRPVSVCDVCGSLVSGCVIAVDGEELSVCDECAPAFARDPRSDFRPRTRKLAAVCVLALPMLHFAYTSADRSMDVRVATSAVGNGEIITSEMFNESSGVINEEVSRFLSGRP